MHRMAVERIEIVQGDITCQDVDAIVNAANRGLLGGGGVDGAIHRAAGPELLAECKTIGGCPTGEARITRAYALKAQYVIHAVGPVWKGGRTNESDLLESCYQSSLRLAMQNRCRTIAFPAISCGAYGYPWIEAAKVSLDAVRRTLQGDDSISLVRWVLFGDEIFETWQNCLRELANAIP